MWFDLEMSASGVDLCLSNGMHVTTPHTHTYTHIVNGNEVQKNVWNSHASVSGFKASCECEKAMRKQQMAKMYLLVMLR